MELPESQALQELVAWCRASSGPVSNPMLIEHFRDSPHGEHLYNAQAYGEQLAETEEQAREFLKHTIWKLEIKQKNKEIESLGERLRKGLLSKEEHQQYAKMISDVQALKRRLQTEAREAR